MCENTSSKLNWRHKLCGSGSLVGCFGSMLGLGQVVITGCEYP